MRNAAIALTSLLAVVYILFNFSPFQVSAVQANHIVISELQIAGDTTTDEFVELYNPTDTTVDLTDWELFRKTAAVDAEEQLIATLSGSITSGGFYLVTHTGYDDIVTGDITYSDQNIANNNTVILRDDTGTIVDLLGLGDSNTSETSTATAPIDNRSLERKAKNTSTPDSMAPGGDDEEMGNGEDTDNNSEDFVRHTSPVVSNPQNTSSTTETLLESTPTPTLIPTATPTPTDGPTPTNTPTPTPTDTPTPTPTPTPTTEPTSTPTPTPISEPTPTPTTTPTPTLTPPPSQVIGIFNLSDRTLTCSIHYTPRVTRLFTLFIPRISCVNS